MTDESRAGLENPPAERGSSRRVLWIAGLIAAVGIFRACLPVAAELGIEATGGRVVAGEVEVENVDFGLLAGRVRIQGLSVGQAGDSGAVPLAALDLMEVDVSPIALLQGRVHLQGATVEGIRVALPRNEAGRVENPLLIEIELPETVPPIRVDGARVADLSLGFLDPYAEAPLFEASLAKLALSGLDVEPASVAIGDVEVVAPSVFLDRGLLEGPRSLPQAYASEEAADDQEAEDEGRALEGGEPVEIAEAADGAESDSSAEVGDGEGARAGSAPEPPPASPDSFELTLGHLLVKDASVDWLDRSFTPPLEEREAGLTLELEDLRLSEQGLAALTIDGSGLRGEHFVVTASSDRESLDVRFESEPFRLDPFDPYARSLAGFAIRDGRIAVTSQMKMQGARIASENAVTLYDLMIDGDTFFKDVIGFGANLVFSLLANEAGVVQLTFPVDHDLDQDLDDNVKATVNAVLRSALRDAVADAGGKVGEDGRIEFDPFEVIPGSPELRSGQQARLSYLGDLLARRERLTLTLKGSVDDSDRAALANARGIAPNALPASDLEALARRRAEELQRVLIEDYSVPADRLRRDDALAEGRSGVLAVLDTSTA